MKLLSGAMLCLSVATAAMLTGCGGGGGGSSTPSNESVTITGKIVKNTDSQNTPTDLSQLAGVANVTVKFGTTVASDQTTSVAFTTKTNSDGTFSFQLPNSVISYFPVTVYGASPTFTVDVTTCDTDITTNTEKWNVWYDDGSVNSTTGLANGLQMFSKISIPLPTKIQTGESTDLGTIALNYIDTTETMPPSPNYQDPNYTIDE